MDDRGPSLVGTAVVFLVLTWIALILRGYVRVKITKKLLFDDFMLLIAMAMFNIFVGLYLIAAHWGLGKHMNDPRVESLRNAVQAWFYGDIFYTISSTIYRLAAGEHLMRHVTRRSQQWVVYIFTWINIIYGFYMIFVLIFQCRPIYHFWERTMPGPGAQGVCHYDLARWSLHFQSGIAAIIDFTYASMPLLILRDLRIPSCQRNAVIAVVLVSQLSAIAMVVRIPYIKQMQLKDDWSWVGADVAIWSIIEPGMGIFSLCLATFCPIMTYLWPLSNQKAPPAYDGSGPYYRRDFKSESALRGIPLDTGYGNISYVESQSGLRNSSNWFSKMKEDNSSETLTGSGEQWDIGIVKTTNVITILDDDVATVTQPENIFRR